MKSKPCTDSTVGRSASNERMRNNKHSFDDAVKGVRSEVVQTASKRKSTGSLERPEKRSKTTQSQSSRVSVISGADLSLSDYPALSGCSGHSLSLDPSDFLLLSETSSPRKRQKSDDDEAEEGPKKRSRGLSTPAEDHQAQPRGSVSSEVIPQASRDVPAPSSSDNSGKPSSVDTVYSARAVFEARYTQQKKLGEGGFGSVYAGFRKADNVPVAIKRIPRSEVEYTTVVRHGKIQVIPLEVALMQRFQPTDSGPSAVVTLLDWFDLGQEVILVLERPAPCMDLLNYLNSTGLPMPEHQAKVIAKQLIDALIEVESRGVFHRDIKLENILIETGSDVPRVRIIDFGCGTHLSEGFYPPGSGTALLMPPELFQHRCLQARPTTVWQLGVLMYTLLHGHHLFHDIEEVVHVDPKLDESLSFRCQRFLRVCLSKSPGDRATLEKLKTHLWLK